MAGGRGRGGRRG